MRDVRQALASAASPTFFFLPIHSWHQASFQRPQQLARALGEIGCSVVYAEQVAIYPWSTVDEQARNCDLGVREVSANVHVVRLPQEYLRWLITNAAPDCVVGYSALEQTPWLPESALGRLVYDVIDHELILNPRGDVAWRHRHATWLAEARVVVATADDIAAWLRPSRPDVILVRNAVRVEDWRATDRRKVPQDMQPARAAPVVVYYHGILGDPWFDWLLWESCCRLRPDWAFVVVGWPRGETEEELRARVRRIPNCHYLGQKAYGELPSYLGSCDVAAVPFQVHEGTHAASVIKVFEYFAAGKPVVATPIREISKYQSVLTAETPLEFVEQIESAMKLARDQKYQSALSLEAESNTWVERARTIRATLLEKAVPPRSDGPLIGTCEEPPR